MNRPVRGGLGIVIVLLVIGGAAVLSFAPGGWGALPIVQYFKALGAFDLATMFTGAIVLVVVAKALLDARKWKGQSAAVTPPRLQWTLRQFLASLVMAPLFTLAGAWFLRGSEGFVVGGGWVYVYMVLCVLLGGLWLASVFSAFRSVKWTLLWILGGSGIVVSVMAVRASEVVLGDWFGEIARVQGADRSEYVLLSKCKVRLRGRDHLYTTRLCRVQMTFLGLTRYETLVETQTAVTDYGIYPENGRLVRPEGFPSADQGDLYVSEDGFIAHVWGDMGCDLAFDTKTGRGYGQYNAEFPRDGGPEEMEIHRKGMKDLPPFRLLEAGGRPSPWDVESLGMEAERRAKELQPGQTKVWYDRLDDLAGATQERVLEEALQSRNEFVRAAAGRIIRAGGKAVYPAAFERLR